MRKLALLVWIALAAACGRPATGPLTPCERDCINDSGGPKWCAQYCKEHGRYGPPQK